MGWGLGAWSSIGSFSNPYFVQSSTAPFDYAQPVVINNIVSADATADANAAATAENQAAMQLFDDGLAAFKQADYPLALRNFNDAVKRLPGDPVLHEMRALTYFTLGKFQQSAAVLNSLLATAPGMDWTTMSSLYGNIDDYTNQLRALEQHVRNSPNDAAAIFVLAYHYLVMGHHQDAIESLRTVVKLQPKDAIARRLLDSLTPPDDVRPAPTENTTANPATTDPAANTPQTDLVGRWLAKPDGIGIELTIAEDSRFTWQATPQGKPAVKLQGTLTAGSEMLILETETQGAMVGQVRSGGADKFQFVIAGGPPNDPGLAFIRQK